MYWSKFDSQRMTPHVQKHHRICSSLRVYFHPGSSDTLSHPGALLLIENLAPHKIALAIDHPWSPPSVQ